MTSAYRRLPPAGHSPSGMAP